jgi:predicted enzyme related to lactoylglutathione lyase
MVVWFEIPVKDLNRAVNFYSKVLGVEVQPMETGPNKMAFFPFAPGVASGALVESKENAPNGFIATFKDTEGNRVALHSLK